MYLMRRKGFKGYGGYGAVDATGIDVEWKKAYENQYGSANTRGAIMGASVAAGNALTNTLIYYAFQPKKKKAFKIFWGLTTLAGGIVGFFAFRKMAKNQMEATYVIDYLDSQLNPPLPEETTVEVVPGSEDVEIIQG